MSLINQMLKDLDARKQHGAGRSTQEVEVVVCHAPRRSRTLPTLVVSIVVVAVSVTGAWWFLNSRTVVSPQVPLVVQSQVNVERTTNEAQPVVEDELVVENAVAPEAPVVPQTEFSAGKAHSVQTVAPILPEHAVLLAEAPISSPDAGTVVEAEEDTVTVAVGDQLSPAPASMVIKPPSLAEQAHQLRIEGRALIQQQRYRDGAQFLNQAIQIEHSSAQSWQELVRVWVQAGEILFAMDVATRGCEAYPDDIGLRVYRARLIVESGDYDSALTVLQTGLVPQVEVSSDYYALLASVLQQKSRFSEAGEQYALLTTSYPQRGDWWIGRAICADQIGSSKQAMAYYQQAITCRNLNSQLKQFALQQLTRLGKG